MNGHSQMIGAAIASVAGSVAKGVLKKKGAGKLASAREEASSLLGSEFRRTEAEMAPWRTIGGDALDRMAISLGLPDQYGRTEDGRDFSEFFKSPGYEFRRDEGIKAVERSATSRRMLQSGPAMKAVQRYGEGLASDEYSNYMNLLGGLSQQGLGVTTNLGMMRANTAANRANMISGAGVARQSGYESLAGMAGDISGTVGGYLGARGPQEESKALTTSSLLGTSASPFARYTGGV